MFSFDAISGMCSQDCTISFMILYQLGYFVKEDTKAMRTLRIFYMCWVQILLFGARVTHACINQEDKT